MTMRFLYIICILICCSDMFAQKVEYTEEDKVIYDRFIEVMKNKRELPLNELIIQSGTFFLGTPYVASTLEKEPEQLVINLREMDCTTFVENVLALSLTLKEDNPSFHNFCKTLQTIRYRNGEIIDYTSRLHYMTDWIFENEKKGIVKDIDREIGGKPLPVNLSFISTHPDSYKQLKTNPELVSEMKQIEASINSRNYFYIPENTIICLEDKFENGDIVCFTTKIEGLDVTHVGFIYLEANKVTFMHASTSAKKVIINEEPLKEYVKRIKSTTGIMIIRPI